KGSMVEPTVEPGVLQVFWLAAWLRLTHETPCICYTSSISTWFVVKFECRVNGVAKLLTA
ncbi:MAG: hypothetical protein KC910_32605, partial [Candidatus Eremiobacteraeota bacterium]|nr:hypothetical protein [Candidatus Eremiobacteraeota bacterium]